MTIITLNGEGLAKVILSKDNKEFEAEVLVDVVAKVKGKWVNNIYGLEPHLAYSDYDFDINADDITDYEIKDAKYEDAEIVKFLEINKINFEISDTEPDEGFLESHKIIKRLKNVIKMASN